MVIDSIGGVSISSIVIGIRFFGALWASIGLIYIVWGLTDYMFSHENAHHKSDGQMKIAKGFSFLFFFAVVWAAIKLLFYYF